MSNVKAFRCSTGSAARRGVIARAAHRDVSWQQRGAAVALATVLATGSVGDAALASEFDLLSEETPKEKFLIDDAGAINRTTKKEVNDRLKRLEIETGYRVTAATVRKLEVEADAFAFSDRLHEQWYPDGADKKGILLVVTSGKDGALTGGKDFVAKIGDEFIDSVVGENVPILTQEEKYNELMSSTTKRIEAVLTGKNDPGPPIRNDPERKRTFKTKEEVEKTKTVSTTVVGTLLFIAVVVPMLQYYGYTSRD